MNYDDVTTKMTNVQNKTIKNNKSRNNVSVQKNIFKDKIKGFSILIQIKPNTRKFNLAFEIIIDLSSRIWKTLELQYYQFPACINEHANFIQYIN